LAGAVGLILVVTVGVVGVVVVTRLVNNDPKPKPTVAAQGGASCSYGRATAGSVTRVVRPPIESNVLARGLTQVQIRTNQGPLVLMLDRAKTPCTVNNFVSLSAQKYFDGTPCHRLTTSGIYVLQCGDPGGTGTGGPGYTFADENLPADTTTPITYPAGTAAMANAGPGTNGSQFFLVYRDSPLPPAYTMFGKITSGLGVLEQVAAAGSEPAGDGKPKKAVNVESVTTR